MLKGKLKEKVSDPNAVIERQGKKVINILSQYKLGKDILMTVRERYLIPQK